MIKFRPYQQEAIEKGVACLRAGNLFLLYMKMRLGKTLTSLAIMDAMGYKKVLFVTKAKRDVQKSVEDDYKLLNPNFELHIVSMDSIYKAPNYEKYNLGYLRKLEPKKIKMTSLPIEMRKEYDACIIDEAHSFSGNFGKSSLRTEIAKKIIGNLPQIQMSGTPTPESWSAIYNQLSLSQYSPFRKYKNFYQWARDFVIVKQKRVGNGRMVNDYSNAKIELIKPIIEPIMVTYDESYADFNQTEFKEIVHTIETPPQLSAIMSQLARDKVVPIMGKVLIADTAVKLQGKLHQLSSGHVIINDTPNGDEYCIISDFKVDYIRNNFLNKYKKIAIFYRYQSELIQLQKLPGATTDSHLFESLDESIFLGQFKKDREGVKLSTADIIIFYTLDFAYLSYEQGKARINHKDRQTECVLHLLFSSDGIESDIYKALKKKKGYDVKMFKRDLKRW